MNRGKDIEKEIDGYVKGKINSDRFFYLPIRIKLLHEEALFKDIIKNWVKNYLT